MDRTGWLRRVVRTMVVLALAGGGLAFIAGSAQAAGPIATFVKQSDWGSGYVGQFTVTNATAAALTWRVEFDLAAGTTISSYWGARLNASGGHYVAVGEAWNATLPQSANTVFGYVAQGSGEPLNCRLNGAPCSGTPANPSDIRAPSTPGNLRAVTGTDTLTLRWNPSADDVAVSAYEVYSGANLVATVTGTEYVMPAPPPMIITYRVRALDAAGNASPYAVLTPGGPADTVAPSAPTGLRPGMSSVGWTAATDNVAVAGYDVYVNGEHYGATSNTSLAIPPVGFGSFTFSVVAFDGAGLRSAPLTLAIAIDPGPNSDFQSPTIPTTLRVALGETQLTWTWAASTDNVGVAGYQVFHGSDWSGNVTATSYTEPRPPGQDTFSIRVRAFDSAGNKSAFAVLTVMVELPAPSTSPTPAVR